MLCDVGAEYIHRTRHARVARTDIAAPGRIGWCAWEGERGGEEAMTIAAERRRWPAEGLTRVPYWVYSDRDVYEEEQARIFRGPTWNFLCLEAELPNPNTYRRSGLGAMPVVVTRDRDGMLHAFENRCAHRGSLLVLNECGEARDIVCVYHNWSYDLCGNLTGVAFRKGLRGKGGMPPEARPETHGPRKLKLATLAGLIFGTLAAAAPPLEQYLGGEIVARIRRVMRAPVKVLGGYSQTLPSNWKLYMENVKDTYHASLLHTFFTTFRLNRLSQKGGVIVSDCGGHHVSYALADETLPRTRSAPSPLVGEGWGGGSSLLRETRAATPTPTPSPSPPQVGPARLAHDMAQPGQARVAWGGEHARRVGTDEYAGMRAAQEGF